LPDHPVVAGARQRRCLRPGHRRLAPEALLPPGIAHGLHLRDPRRGAGLRRRPRRRRALRRADLARLPDRALGARSFRWFPGARAHHADRDPGRGEPRRGNGAPADEGAALALPVVRRLRLAGHDALDGSAPEHLPARPCLSATSRSTLSGSAVAACPGSPRDLSTPPIAWAAPPPTPHPPVAGLPPA